MFKVPEPLGIKGCYILDIRPETTSCGVLLPRKLFVLLDHMITDLTICTRFVMCLISNTPI